MAEIVIDVVARLDRVEKQLDQFQRDTEKKLGGFTLPINLAGLNQGLELAKKALNTFRDVGNAVLDSVFEAEKIRAFNSQFENLARQASIAGDALRDGLLKAADGMVDDTDLIQSANRAMIQLGENATRLPETLELARKATTAFGGELVHNFEALNQAFATGNTKALRGLGIVIDSDKAYRDFARSIGVSASSLSEAGRQQAIMNAVLEKGNESFKNVNDRTLEATNEWKRLLVAIAQVGERFKLEFQQTFGPALASMARGLRTVVEHFKGPGSLNEQLDAVNAKIEKVKKTGGFGSELGLVHLNQQAAALRLKIDLAAESQRKLNAVTRSSDSQSSWEDPEKAEADRLKVQSVLFKAQQDRLSALQNLASMTDDHAAMDRVRDEQRMAIIQEFELKKQELKREFLVSGLMDKKEFALLEDKIDAETKARIAALLAALLSTENQINKAIKSTMVQGISVAMQTLGASLAKGASAFKDFGKTLIGLLGDLAITMGTMIVSAGLAKIALITDLGGFKTVAAGAALIAVGGLLKAFAAGSPDTGGGVAASGSAGGLSGGSVATDNFGDIEAQKQNTIVHVNVAGNLNNRREEALHIVEAITEFVGSNGGIIPRAAIA